MNLCSQQPASKRTERDSLTLAELALLDRDTQDPSLPECDAKLAAEQQRLEKRKTQAPPILEKLCAWALEQRGLPKSGVRQAVDYMPRCWDGLTAFLDKAYVPLDSNRAERALRGLVLGRKNHYGSRSKRGTEVAALLYSLVETAKLCGANPADYIYTATIFATELGEALLPWEFAVLPELWPVPRAARPHHPGYGEQLRWNSGTA